MTGLTSDGFVALSQHFVCLPGERLLLSTQGFRLGSQQRNLARFVNSRAGGGGEGGGDQSFLECGHDDGFCGGCSCNGDGGGSGKGGGGGDGGAQSDGRGLDGVGGDHADESAGADGDAAFGEEVAQAFDGAADAFSGRVFVRPDHLADFAERFVLEVAEQDGGAIDVVERVHGFVEQGFDVRPVGGGGVHGVEFVGDLFAELAAGFSSDDINGGPACDLIQPRAEDGVGREAVRLAGEVGESGLGDFLGELRGTDLAERRGKDEIEVATNDFGESILGVLPGVLRKQLQVAVARFHISISSPPRKPDKKQWKGGSIVANAAAKRHLKVSNLGQAGVRPE